MSSTVVCYFIFIGQNAVNAVIHKRGAISSVLCILTLHCTFGISGVLSISVAEIVLCAMPCKKTVQYDPLTYWHYR